MYFDFSLEMLISCLMLVCRRASSCHLCSNTILNSQFQISDLGSQTNMSIDVSAFGCVRTEGHWMKEAALVIVQVASVGLTVKVSALRGG